jgi:hypothetical protein
MGGERHGQHGVALREALSGPAIVHIRGRQQAETTVVMLLIVPAEASQWLVGARDGSGGFG